MSIENCKIPKSQDHILFLSENQPKKNEGYTYLNQQALLDKYSTEVKTINTENKWGSQDPRLISAARGNQVLMLDRQPIDGRIPLDRISTDKSLDNYGKSYKTYSDINAGHITYYVDNSIKDPFFEPIYTIPAHITGKLYKDPMDSFKPQYERHFLRKDPVNSANCSYNGCLSWMEDSQEHREDIMSKQMRKHNEQRWQNRWG
jgi:hypothetical protein